MNLFIKKYFPYLILIAFLSCNEEISTTPPAEEPQAGLIYVNSNPTGASIFLDGLNTGRVTPDSLKWLESGEHKILLRLSGWKDQQIITYLEENEKENYNVDFRGDPANYGAIYCTSTPSGANIFFNDSATGQVTPYTISNLQPGSYKILLSKINYLNDSIYVSVSSQKTTEASIVLKDTSEMVVYNTSNSNIPTDLINCIAVDKNNIKWIGTSGGGLASFDEVSFTTYNAENSPLPFMGISSIYVDEQNNKWIGTTYEGFTKFDGTNWTVYNSTNTNLPEDMVIKKITGDKNGNIWVATIGSGLIKFDGTSCTYFKEENTGLSLNIVYDIAIDNNNIIYVALANGIGKYNKNNWALINSENSGIPNRPIVLTFSVDNSLVAGFNLTDAERDSGVAAFHYYKASKNKWIAIEGIPGYYTFMMRDNQGLIWVTGLATLQYFERYTMREFWCSGSLVIPKGAFSSIACDNNNVRWIGMQSGGLIKFKRKFQ